MYRLLMPLVLLSLAGCGQKDAGAGRDSAAPAYVPPATTSNDAAVEDQQVGAPEATDEDVDRAALESVSETPPYNAKDDSPPPPDEELNGDDSQASDTAATDAKAGAPDFDANRTAAAEELAADLADITPDASAGQPKGSGSKLFRGLANSVSRAVMKTFAEPSAAPAPPPEDDPFPNGEPADADPDVNR